WIARDEEDPELRVLRAELPGELRAGHARHEHVRDEHVRGPARALAQAPRVRGVARLEHLEAELFEVVADEHADERIVLDEERSGRERRGAPVGRRGLGGRARRELHEEARALALLALDADRALELPHHGEDRGEPETGAAPLLLR